MCMQWGAPLLKGWTIEQAYGVYWLWVMLVVIPFCFLFFRWIEKPGMKFGERFPRQRANPAPRTVGPSVSEIPVTERTPRERLRELVK